MKRRLFSAAEFDRGAALSRMDPDNIAIAREILVKGRRQADTAREGGIGRQRVSQVARKMRQWIEEANPAPPGWITDTVTLPAADWLKVRHLERAARDKLLKQKDR